MEARTLRPHQADALEMLRDSLCAGKKRPILQAPTGYGKTVLAGAIIGKARAKGKRVCFVVPAISLVDQTVESFARDGITDVGVIQAQHTLTNWSKPVQVASIQTIARKGYPEADLVLVDESHKIFKAQTDWMAHPDWQKVPFIGFSATPWTKGLGKHYDDLIISATTQSLIKTGFLAPFRVFAPSHPDLTGVKTVAGDYHEGQLSDAMNKQELVGNIVETWLVQGEGRPTLCFAVDCAHAKHIQRQFEEAGIPCGYIDARTELTEREAVRVKFASGEYKVVANVGCLTTGIDWDVRCIILARPTQSEMLFVQIIGRGLRTAEGKQNLLVLDHSDTHNRLGFVTDIHYNTLDDGKQKVKDEKKKVRLPKECPKCHYLRPVGVLICPACGHQPELPPGMVHAEGKLSEITRVLVGNTVPPGCIRIGSEVMFHHDFYAQLMGYAVEKDYKMGWASNKYKEMVGVWPDFRRHNTSTPTPAVRSWIRAQQRAFAKRKDKEQSKPLNV